MHGEVKSHFSTLKASGECLAKGKYNELEHGDVVFIVAKVKVDKLTFSMDKDGMITRQQSAKADDEMFIVTPEEFDSVASKYKEDESGQLSITGEMARNGDFENDGDDDA